MMSHHKLTTYYPKGNGQAKLANKTLGKLLTKLVNAYQTNWDVMLVTALWAYWTANKVTTQYTPFKLVYGIQLITPVEFAIPTKKIHNLSRDDLDNAIRVKMENLVDWMELVGKLEKILTIFSCCTKNKRMKKGRWKVLRKES